MKNLKITIVFRVLVLCICFTDSIIYASGNLDINIPMSFKSDKKNYVYIRNFEELVLTAHVINDDIKISIDLFEGLASKSDDFEKYIKDLNTQSEEGESVGLFRTIKYIVKKINKNVDINKNPDEINSDIDLLSNRLDMILIKIYLGYFASKNNTQDFPEYTKDQINGIPRIGGVVVGGAAYLGGPIANKLSKRAKEISRSVKKMISKRLPKCLKYDKSRDKIRKHVTDFRKFKKGDFNGAIKNCN